jgi:carbonic anhydrase
MSEPGHRVEIYKAETPKDIAAVKSIFLEYLTFMESFLDQPLYFQGPETELKTFPDAYSALLIAKVNDIPVAACGIKHLRDDICELKRLYCRPEGRGHNLGEKLTRASLETARLSGHSHIYLDTDPGLVHACKIYEKLGFTDIERYYDNPMGCSRYMALAL